MEQHCVYFLTNRCLYLINIQIMQINLRATGANDTEFNFEENQSKMFQF